MVKIPGENLVLGEEIVVRNGNANPNEKVVLYVGRFDERKGIETLVRAIGERICFDQ